MCAQKVRFSRQGKLSVVDLNAKKKKEKERKKEKEQKHLRLRKDSGKMQNNIKQTTYWMKILP